MEEKEIPNVNRRIVHQYVVHKSVGNLILRGGLAWLLLAAMDYAFDRLPDLAALVNATVTLTTGEQALFHFLLNILYGWLLLYLVLSWYMEYFTVTKDGLVVRQGFFFIDEEVFPTDDIKTIDVSRDLLQKILKDGTIHIYFWRLRRWVHLRDVSDPYDIAEFIIQTQRTAQKAKGRTADKEDEYEEPIE